MALNKLSKPKQFHVDYCGCTAAALLLNDQTIRDAIDFTRHIKTKRDYVKTTITILKDGVKIIYNDDQKFSTVVPSTMIASSTVGKTSFEDTVGVVYISPLNGQHYPAFVHVYRCDSSRSAQKLVSRLRTYLLVESHRLQIAQLEQLLLNRNLLNIDHFNARNSQKNSTGASSLLSSATSDSREENKIDPIKSITDELQKKINSQQPLLFPPKDYDTIHAAHGNIQRAQAWRSTQPTIVGYSPIDSDNGRISQHLQTSTPITKDERKNKAVVIENNNDKSRLTSQRSDATVDPVEAVSLAFDFLKDETSSIFTDNGGNIEHLDMQQQSKPSKYRFRPTQIAAVTKNLFTQNNNYDLSNGISQSDNSSRNDLDAYNSNHHHHHQHNNNSNNNHHIIKNGNRARSEMRLDYDPQPNVQHNHFYENRYMKGNGAAIVMNPIWAAQSPNMTGSQPNLLSPQNYIDSTPVHRQSSPSRETQMPAIPVQNSLYASYPDNKPGMRKQEENQQKRPMPAQQQLNRKQAAQSQYLDTNEFILRASTGQPLRNAQYPNRPLARDYRPHSMNDNGAMLDVYY
ncbi:unnamed protein product [Rotaria magnacalcarata]|uniref:PID domain-containing protein n=1 Tax=Rotaria magnacalcarata TaxID=392030 RepID=A0A818XLK0_9BILA|nr:unnamed protein product [Rotaria magnacalcarata]CAF2095782.1 unnamed protein product [Rotaria magnacalcarata]CAF3738522.1 unnamed protein product [Rotaria magnacalcarata]CAF3783885.1 unnamed protein product [Rotaria magnacalcarata]